MQTLVYLIILSMAKWKLKAQDKNKIRNKDEVLVDLHFHLGKQDSLKEPLGKLVKAIDVISITGRGDRFANIFEYDFVSFLNQLKNESILLCRNHHISKQATQY